MSNKDLNYLKHRAIRSNGRKKFRVDRALSTAAMIAMLCLFFGTWAATHVQAQDVIRATGGTELSVDNVGGDFTTLSGPTIRETSVGQLEAGETIILTLPDSPDGGGYEWNEALDVMPNAGQGADTSGYDVKFVIEPRGAQNTELELEFTGRTDRTFAFTITTESRAAGAGQGPARISIYGLQLRPANANVPDEATITNTGTTGPVVNYGNLSKVAGSIDEVRVETEADGTGVVFPASTILAGNSITVYAIARDEGGNFIENVALDDESDWSLSGLSGGITQAALTASANLRSATFSTTTSGTAVIEADYPDVDLVPSGTITVAPRSADEMVIDTHPSDTAVAGEAFDPQPVIHLLDQFGNLVDDSKGDDIPVTVAIDSGDGPLKVDYSGTYTDNGDGSFTFESDAGVVAFQGLLAETANDITLRFTSGGFNDLVSNTITIEPALASKLKFTSVPSSGNEGINLNPPVLVRLQDAFDNFVPVANTTITVALETDTGNGSLEGTKSVDTDNEGTAVFDDIRYDSQGDITLRADSPGLDHDISSVITIVGADEHSSFRIESDDDTPIGQQTAGEPFDIKITAIDGNGNTVTDYEGTVTLTTSSDFGTGGGTTNSFTDGELVHTVELETAGEHTLTATDDDVTSISGTSDEFTINPAVFDSGKTLITADPDELVADGSSTSEILVQLRDEFENNLITGGEEITIKTDAGRLSAGTESGETELTADDNEDGTYSATLTSSSEAGETATIEAIVDDTQNGISLGNVQVDFVPGNVSEFIISIPMDNGSPAEQTAGLPFEITVEAVDDSGNRVEGYSGTLDFSSNSDISSGQSGAISDGILENHTIILTKSGTDITISAEDSDLFGVSGTSPVFTVVAADPDVEESSVTVNPSVLQNDGTSESVITVTLRDEFTNKILTDLLSDLDLELEQITVGEDRDPSSGEPDADITSPLAFDSGTSTYQATLTSSSTLEKVEVQVSYDFPDNGKEQLADTPTIDIVLPNVWEPSGSPQQRDDWTRAENWSLGNVPVETDFVIFPGGLGDYPVVDVNPVIGALEIQDGGLLEVEFDSDLTISGSALVDGTLDIRDNTELNVGGNFNGTGSFAAGKNAIIEIGGDVTIEDFLARTDGTVVKLNGETQQTLTTSNLLVERLEIRNDVLATSGDVIDTAELDISEGNTFELEEGAGITVDNIIDISGNGTFILNDNTLVVRGDLTLVNIDTSEGTVVFGIREGEDFDDPEYAGLDRQQVNNLSEMKQAVVNNPFGVRTYEDIIIDDSGSLELRCGPLIISSGKSLIASNISYDTNDPAENCSEPGRLQFRRIINATPGWRMMSSPVRTTYEELFDGLTLQGINGTVYDDRQPNLLYYDEQADTDTTGTAQSRWRAPGGNTDSLQTGRGYFFYVFGDPSDGDYNDQLPKTLTASGRENDPPAGGEFDFNITLSDTVDQDTLYVEIFELGWNLIGNPFGATIDWDDALNGSGKWDKENVDDVVYIWKTEDAGGGEITGEYLTWNGETGSLGNGKIPPFQAFWVKANQEEEETDPALKVNKTAKSTGGQFRQKTRAQNTSHQIVLRLEAGGLETKTYIHLSDNGRIGIDPKDAYLLEPMANTFLNFYSLAPVNGDSPEYPLVINHLPRKSEHTYEIPLGVRGYENGSPIRGTYGVSLDPESSFPNDWDVRLKDNVSGETVSLQNDQNTTKDNRSVLEANVDHFAGLREKIEVPGIQKTIKGKPPIADIGPLNLVKAESSENKNESRNSTLSYADKEFPFTLFITPDELDEGDVPNRPFLDQNYPNPFNPETTIRFGLTETQNVRVDVYDVLGRRVQTLVNETRDEGVHTAVFDGTRLASGVYIYRMQTADKVITRKMMLVK